jgi:hypothetical protein
MGKVSVVFLLCRVGDSPTAEGFLKKIEDDKKLKDMVYCSRERIDKQLAIFQETKNDPVYFGWVCFGFEYLSFFESIRLIACKLHTC